MKNIIYSSVVVYRLFKYVYLSGVFQSNIGYLRIPPRILNLCLNYLG